MIIVCVTLISITLLTSWQLLTKHRLLLYIVMSKSSFVWKNLEKKKNTSLSSIMSWKKLRRKRLIFKGLRTRNRTRILSQCKWTGPSKRELMRSKSISCTTNLILAQKRLRKSSRRWIRLRRIRSTGNMMRLGANWTNSKQTPMKSVNRSMSWTLLTSKTPRQFSRLRINNGKWRS
jgi:hypothetical protein